MIVVLIVRQKLNYARSACGHRHLSPLRVGESNPNPEATKQHGKRYFWSVKFSQSSKLPKLFSIHATLHQFEQ